MNKLILFFLVPSLALGQCPNAVLLKVGDAVTDCPRVGLSIGYDKSVREILHQADTYQAIIQEQKTLIDAKSLSLGACTQEIAVLKADDARERAATDSERSRGKTEFFIGMGVGIVAIALSAWALHQVAR